MIKYNLYKQLPARLRLAVLYAPTLLAGVLINGGLIKTKIMPNVLIN